MRVCEEEGLGRRLDLMGSEEEEGREGREGGRRSECGLCKSLSPTEEGKTPEAKNKTDKILRQAHKTVAVALLLASLLCIV